MNELVTEMFVEQPLALPGSANKSLKHPKFLSSIIIVSISGSASQNSVL